MKLNKNQHNIYKLIALSILINLGTGFSAFSQNFIPNAQFSTTPNSSSEKKSSKSPYHVSMNMEAGFQSSPFFKEGIYFQRLNPEINYMLSKEFTAFAGVQQTWVQNFNQLRLNHDGNFEITKTNTSYMLWYAGGSYQLSPKIQLSGLAWKQVDQQSIMQIKTEPPNFDAQGFQLYMNYQISDNVQINASFNYRQGNSGNYFYNDFQDPFRPIGISRYNVGTGFGNNTF